MSPAKASASAESAGQPREPHYARVVKPIGAVALAKASLALAGFSVAGGKGRATAISRAAAGNGEVDTVVAEAKAAAEAAKLELEAAKLRAEAEEMEKERAVEKRRNRAVELLGEGTTVLSVEALRERLKEVEGVEVSEDQAKNLGASFTYDDLASVTFEKALEKIAVEERAKLRAREAEEERERARMQKEAANNARNEQRAVPTEVNDDRSINTRVLASLPYLLPLVDGLQFGIGLLQLVPALMPLFAILAIPSALLNAIPFGSLIVFILLTVLANQRELPQLLRFNLQQAVYLDVALFIPTLFASVVSLATGGNQDTVRDFGEAVYVVLIAAVVYAVALTIIGKDPDGLPFFSDAARRSVDQSDSRM